MTHDAGESLWPLLAPLLPKVEKPGRYINHEYGSTHKAGAEYRAVLIYPDTYEIGQSNQGIAILYNQINALCGVACERAFVPWVDMAALMRERKLPLFSLESCAAVRGFDLVGITLPHELCYTNVLEALDLAGIPLHANDRAEADPIVIGGGPCSYNPEPVAEFFDVFSIGEGEYALPEFVEMHRRMRDAGASRGEILREAAHLSGFYVPSLYVRAEGTAGAASAGDTAGTASATAPAEVSGVADAVLSDAVPASAAPSAMLAPIASEVPREVVKRVVADFEATPALSQDIVPYVEVAHDRLAIEVLRGCARGCRFCQAGMVYRPVRERGADQIVSSVARGLACTGFDEVSLTSLSTTDHSQLAGILRRVNRSLEDSAMNVSIPSTRVDAFGMEMALLVAGQKKGGLTLAPEAGTQRMRDIINKNVTEEDLTNAVLAGLEAGWQGLKLYFMLGLPFETDDDVAGIGALVERLIAAIQDRLGPKAVPQIRVSCAVFVPKPQTPFQWCGQVPPSEVKRRQALLRDSMPKRHVKLSWHDAEASLVEAAMARGDRSLAPVIEGAWRKGEVFDAWTELFDFGRWVDAASECGVSLEATACAQVEPGSPLPWGHISAGVCEAYLLRELENAKAAVRTPDCTFAGCTGCGVCPSLGVRNDIKGVRRG